MEKDSGERGLEEIHEKRIDLARALRKEGLTSARYVNGEFQLVAPDAAKVLGLLRTAREFENKARRPNPCKDVPFVELKRGKVVIEIGSEKRSYTPSVENLDLAARFLAETDVGETGVRVAPSVNHPDSSKDGETYGVDVSGWLRRCLHHAVVLRELATVRAARRELAGG